MKTILQNTHIAGQSIGLWKSVLTPDNTIVWMKPKRIFGKEHKVVVYATPHLDEPNVVSVDVVNLSHDNDRTTLSTKFRLSGQFLASDLKMYLVQIGEIISMLK
jgi:hypothetical protein